MANVGQMIQQYNLNQEKDYAGNLLGYAMGSGGDFSMVGDTPQFTPGGNMPTKTEAWNTYLQMKGGKVTGQDLAKFNQLYTQAQGIQTQNQIQELQKLSLQGAEPDEIQDLVGNNDQMYNNMLDMITGLEGSGNEQAFQQAQMLKGYLPQEESAGLIGDMFDEGLSLGGVAALGAAGFGGMKAREYAMGRAPEAMEDYKKAYKAKMGPSRETARADQAKLNRLVQKRADLLNKGGVPEIQKQLMNKAIATQQKKVHGSWTALKNLDIRGQAPLTRGQRASQWLGKGGRGGLGMLAYLAAQPVGEALGGEKGGKIARGGVSLAMLGQAARTLGPMAMGKGIHGSILGALLMGGFGAYDLYNQSQGE